MTHSGAWDGIHGAGDKQAHRTASHSGRQICISINDLPLRHQFFDVTMYDCPCILLGVSMQHLICHTLLLREALLTALSSAN